MPLYFVMKERYLWGEFFKVRLLGQRVNAPVDLSTHKGDTLVSLPPAVSEPALLHTSATFSWLPPIPLRPLPLASRACCQTFVFLPVRWIRDGTLPGFSL